MIVCYQYNISCCGVWYAYFTDIDFDGVLEGKICAWKIKAIK